MKKDVFNTWIKEFASLIFTQTVQAFLLAAIMTVIVTTAQAGSEQDQDVGVSTTGVIAIIALTSISKIESLVKKIFGVESQFGDPAMKNGMGAFAGGLVAAKLAQRALNNVPKMAKGVGGYRQGRKDVTAAKQRYIRDMNTLKAKSGNNLAAGNMNATESAQGVNPVNVEAEQRRNSATAQMQATSSRGSSASSPSQSAIDQEKKNKIEDKYQEALAAAKKKQREGIYSGLSGALETASMLPGAAVGATVGLATGSGALKGAASGVGVSDMLAGLTVGAANVGDSAVRGAMSLKPDRDKRIDLINKQSEQIFGSTKKAVNGYVSARKRENEIIDKLQRDMTAGDI